MKLINRGSGVRARYKFFLNLNITLTLFLLFACLNLAQTDWQRWEATEINYQKSAVDDSVSFNSSGVGSVLISSLKSGYSFLWSDHDGDNCPFYPTCSAFFVEAVRQTNIFKGTLMFADRFTRDSNLFKSLSQYEIYFTGRLNDPVIKYTLQQDSVDTFYRKLSE